MIADQDQLRAALVLAIANRSEVSHAEICELVGAVERDDQAAVSTAMESLGWIGWRVAGAYPGFRRATR